MLSRVVLSRKVLIYVHVILASVYLPYLIVVSLSGGLYLIDIKGQQVKTRVFEVKTDLPDDIEDVKKIFIEYFVKEGIDYKFDNLVKRDKNFVFRPSTREHYIAQWESPSESYSVFKVKPTLLSKLMELHKGHGAHWSRWYQASLGLALLVISVTGILLAFPVKKYRQIFFLLFTVNLILIFTLLY